MTVYVELELTAYLLSVDDCRHVIISFIEQCQYSLVNIVVDKDNTFLRTLNQVGHESIGIINLPIVEHTTGDQRNRRTAESDRRMAL